MRSQLLLGLWENLRDRRGAGAIMELLRKEPLFRVWLAGYGDWQPSGWQDVPPQGVAIRPLAKECLTATEAEEFVESFNRQMLREPKNLWAVPVPVQLVVLGEPVPGELFTSGISGFAE